MFTDQVDKISERLSFSRLAVLMPWRGDTFCRNRAIISRVHRPLRDFSKWTWEFHCVCSVSRSMVYSGLWACMVFWARGSLSVTLAALGTASSVFAKPSLELWSVHMEPLSVTGLYTFTTFNSFRRGTTLCFSHWKITDLQAHSAALRARTSVIFEKVVKMCAKLGMYIYIFKLL